MEFYLHFITILKNYNKISAWYSVVILLSQMLIKRKCKEKLIKKRNMA